MKYPKITSLVPEGEHFDESGIVNEGGFLSIKHLDNIEKIIAGGDSALESANLLIQQDAGEVTRLTEELAAANVKTETLKQKNAAKKEKIKTLEAKVAELGGESSGAGTVITTTKDANAEENKTGEKVSLNDPEHPLNQYALKVINAKKSLRKK
jgi:hypothetical protein